MISTEKDNTIAEHAIRMSKLELVNKLEIDLEDITSYPRAVMDL